MLYVCVRVFVQATSVCASFDSPSLFLTKDIADKLSLLFSQFENSDRVCGSVCQSIASLCRETDSNRKAAVDHGLLTLVLRAMTAHTPSEFACVHACSALWNIACNGENKVKVVRARALDTLYGVMEAQQGSASVMKMVRARVLCGVAAVCDRRQFVTPCVCGTVVQAAGVLMTLSVSPDNREPIGACGIPACHCQSSLNSSCACSVASGGLSRLLSAMSTHKSVAGLQEQSCKALWNIAFTSPLQPRIIDAGGLARLINALEYNKDSAEVRGCCHVQLVLTPIR